MTLNGHEERNGHEAGREIAVKAVGLSLGRPVELRAFAEGLQR
jgi:hypothetical protein